MPSYFCCVITWPEEHSVPLCQCTGGIRQNSQPWLDIAEPFDFVILWFCDHLMMVTMWNVGFIAVPQTMNNVRVSWKGTIANNKN